VNAGNMSVTYPKYKPGDTVFAAPDKSRGGRVSLPAPGGWRAPIVIREQHKGSGVTLWQKHRISGAPEFYQVLPNSIMTVVDVLADEDDVYICLIDNKTIMVHAWIMSESPAEENEADK